MNRLLICGATLGLISVIMGAVGDHAFHLSPEHMKGYETAVRYNMFYALLILVLSFQREKSFTVSGVIFSVGVILFSFSIYAARITGIESLTYITPVGGLTLMAGWAWLIISEIFKLKRT